MRCIWLVPISVRLVPRQQCCMHTSSTKSGVVLLSQGHQHIAVGGDDGCNGALQVCDTPPNRIHLVLFGMQNRTSGPYLAANNRILISLARCSGCALCSNSAHDRHKKSNHATACRCRCSLAFAWLPGRHLCLCKWDVRVQQVHLAGAAGCACCCTGTMRTT
jgi:hypothetical protein